MKLKEFLNLYKEEDEIVKYFNQKDWDQIKDDKCVVCKKAFKEGELQMSDEVVSDIKGNLYHKKCFDERFNKDKDLKLRKAEQPGD